MGLFSFMPGLLLSVSALKVKSSRDIFKQQGLVNLKVTFIVQQQAASRLRFVLSASKKRKTALSAERRRKAWDTGKAWLRRQAVGKSALPAWVGDHRASMQGRGKKARLRVPRRPTVGVRFEGYSSEGGVDKGKGPFFASVIGYIAWDPPVCMLLNQFHNPLKSSSVILHLCPSQSSCVKKKYSVLPQIC